MIEKMVQEDVAVGPRGMQLLLVNFRLLKLGPDSIENTPTFCLRAGALAAAFKGRRYSLSITGEFQCAGEKSF